VRFINFQVAVAVEAQDRLEAAEEHEQHPQRQRELLREALPTEAPGGAGRIHGTITRKRCHPRLGLAHQDALFLPRPSCAPRTKLHSAERPQNQLGRYSRGSVIFPVSALAATVAGEARNTCDSLWPMRPGKLRFVALMHFIGEFIRPNVSTGPPRQAAQPAFSVICTPAATRISQTVCSPHRDVCNSCTISGVAGTPKVSMATRLPCS